MIRRAAFGLALVLVPVVTLLLPSPSHAAGRASREPQEVSKGISYARAEFAKPQAICHVLTADLTQGYRLVVGTKAGFSGSEVLSLMARGGGAIAAVNGAFFTMGAARQPIGYIVRDGDLVYKTEPLGASLGVNTAGAVVIGEYEPDVSLVGPRGMRLPLTAINSQSMKRGIGLYTKGYAGRLPGGTAIPLSAGGAGKFRVCSGPDANARLVIMGSQAVDAGDFRKGDVLRTKLASREPWADISALASGGPLLVKGGVPCKSPARGFPGIAGRNPRTIAGSDASGRLVLAVIEGRLAGSPGVSLAEAATLACRLGFVDAVCLDGGDSSEMWIDGLIPSRLSGRVERPLTSALLLIKQ